MNAKGDAQKRLDRFGSQLIDLSHRIHASPELAFEEERACQWISEYLSDMGFSVESGICDLPTAFLAKIGNGPLNVAICAEYDALPSIGHACGHNIIAASSVGAAIALRQVVDDIGVTIRVIGTPAEEDGGGKIILLERGAFDGVHAAMMVHPAPFDIVDPSTLAAVTFEVVYIGKEAHASAFPELGVNAADALTVAQTAIGLLRQHLSPNERVHGIITKGGDAPNIIPAYTTAKYMIRAPSLQKLNGLRKKINNCFEAGALATGSMLEVIGGARPYAEMHSDVDISSLYKQNAEVVGRRFAPLSRDMERAAASTDMGNISQVVPSIHPLIGINSLPSVNHQSEFASHCISASADKAVIDGAMALAWTIIDIATESQIRLRLLAQEKPIV